MFKHGDIFVLTNVWHNRKWENKRIKYNSINSNEHILLDEVVEEYYTFKPKDMVSFSDLNLKEYNAKLVDRKSHLPKWW
jgi:hypothetical protein